MAEQDVPLEISPGIAPSMRSNKPPSRHTQAAWEATLKELPFEDRETFDHAQRGFIATLDGSVRHAGTNFDLSQMGFLRGEAPQTVNPSLWRMAQLTNLYTGLFRVCEGIYQIRSFDMANMTLVQGERGWVVIDPLTSTESSAAGLALANKHLGWRPVVAVIHTHSHADHFLGVLGVASQADVASGKVAVIAPTAFADEALSENILVGPPMARGARWCGWRGVRGRRAAGRAAGACRGADGGACRGADGGSRCFSRRPASSRRLPPPPRDASHLLLTTRPRRPPPRAAPRRPGARCTCTGTSCPRARAAT